MNDNDLINEYVRKFPRLFHGAPPEFSSHVPSGWADLMGRLLADLDLKLSDGQADRFKILQIKEKLAGLRVYWRLALEEAPEYDLIAACITTAEVEASQTCQRCGAPGQAASHIPGWLVTLCDACCKLPAEEL